MTLTPEQRMEIQRTIETLVNENYERDCEVIGGPAFARSVRPVDMYALGWNAALTELRRLELEAGDEPVRA